MPSHIVFEDVVALSQSASAHGQHEVAYHLLAAAMHVAEDNRDMAQLEQVIAVAEHERDIVEAGGHKIDAEHARRRGNQPLFASLLTAAKAKRTTLTAQDVIERHGGGKKVD